MTPCLASRIATRFNAGPAQAREIARIARIFACWRVVYLSGRWFTFDARHNKPRIGRILVARGRHAADCAITTTFGSSRLVQFDIVTKEAKGVAHAA